MSLYLCDPALHRKCRRKNEGMCQRLCILTTVQAFAKDRRALTDYEVEYYENLIRAKVEPGLRIGRHQDSKAQPAEVVEEEPDTEIDKTVREEEAE